MDRDSKIKSLFKKVMGKMKDQQEEKPMKPIYFSKNLKQNEEKVKGMLGITEDAVYRGIEIIFKFNEEKEKAVEALIVCMDGLADEDALRNNIIEPLIAEPLTIDYGDDELQRVKDRVSVFNPSTIETNVEKALLPVLKGSTIVLIDGSSEALVLKTAGYELRAIVEPETEQAIRGSHDGFIESSQTNISLIRRRVPHPGLQFETMKMGEYTQTDVTVAFIKGIADPELIKRIKDRLKQIKVDDILSSGEIEQVIEDHPYTIFPTIGNTERPDKAAFLLMEGRVIIIVDGDPVNLYIPYLFVENIHSLEDYNSRPYFVSLIRLGRVFAFFVSIFLPALYIAILNFHKVMIPSDMLVPLIQAREAVPFPLAIEVFMTILMFELVREAGIRLPLQVGSSLSIVGALIFGQVAVSAGIVGAPTAIVVAVTYITSFINNSIADAIGILRLWLFFAASIFGAYGLFMAILGIITNMISLTSVGVPYMAPIAPFYAKDWKDLFIRFPYRWQKNRPKSVPHQRSRRIKSLPKVGDK